MKHVDLAGLAHGLDGGWEEVRMVQRKTGLVCPLRDDLGPCGYRQGARRPGF